MSSADRFINRHKSRGGQARSVVSLGAVSAAPEQRVLLSDKDRLMLAALEADMNRLKRIQSHATRDVLKRDELLGRYTAYLEALIQQDRAPTPAIIFRNMIWAIDVGQVQWAKTLGLFAIKHGIASPEGFRRDIHNAFVGDMARLALTLQKTKPDAAPWIAEIQKAAQTWDLIDEIRADLLKASAVDAESQGQLQAALGLYQEAIRIYPRCRVTRLINRLEKQLQSTGGTQ